MKENILSPEQTEQESTQDTSLRPALLNDFIGQSELKDNLHVFISAAKKRSESLDHVLFYGPPGLGKTSLAAIVAREMGVNIKSTSGPTLARAADLAAILTNLSEGDVLFIDEIHRLNTAVEEVLYPAMEDYAIDIMIGEGPAARSVRIDLPKFTLVGATTRLGLLSNPLRDRFGIPLRLSFYSGEELKQVLLRAAGKLNVPVTEYGAEEIARRARGTPRIALRLLRRVRDYATVEDNLPVDKDIANTALCRLQVDKIGLDSNDYRYLRFILDNYDGGPVGVETISSALAEQRDAIEEAIEPYLIQIGLVMRTPRGRMITPKAREYLGVSARASKAN